VELRRSGTSIKLREQSFLVLVCLLEHAGEIVTREELRQLLWPSDTFVDFDHSLSTAVMKLREVLGDSTDTPLYIETIPKRGYRFIAPVSLATDSRNGFANPNSDSVSPMTAETSATQSQDEPGGESKGEAQSVARRGRLWMWLLPGGVVLVAGVAGAFWYLHRPLPPLHVTGYTQITHDGHLKILAGTDGARLYFNQVSPLSVAQVAIPGGAIEQIPVALPDPELWTFRRMDPAFLLVHCLQVLNSPFRFQMSGSWEVPFAASERPEPQPFRPTGTPLLIPQKTTESGSFGATGPTLTGWHRSKAGHVASTLGPTAGLPGRPTAARSGSTRTPKSMR
jgi:DNA-binding winged helix-turn-helix (wHTH) protein